MKNIKEDQIRKVQKEWGKGVVKIGKPGRTRKEIEKLTKAFLSEYYAFDQGPVLFKPTEAFGKHQFRTTFDSAKSYFINCNEDFPEDTGFALTPWTNVEFSSKQHFILMPKRALAMGNYFFTDINGNRFKVEFTFGYRLYGGKLKIELQHSSYPFKRTVKFQC